MANLILSRPDVPKTYDLKL